MDTAILPTSGVATAADRLAAGNLRANLAAMGSEWAEIVAAEPGDVEWVFGRDGYLTGYLMGRNSGGWWAGSSAPLRTGRELLKMLELKGNVGCFLQPTHAGQIRACFEKLKLGQAIIGLVPDIESLRMIVRCDDFSKELRASRLFFVSGADWAEQLARLFERHPGMPLPQQFVRTALLEDADMNLLTEDAQAVISRETVRRSERLPIVLERAEKRSRNGRVLVLAGSQFNLGDLSNVALRAGLLGDGADASFVEFDSDHPLTASPLALAEAAADADAIVAADLVRSDLPGIVSPRTAWITWLTSGRNISPAGLGERDALMLADAEWLGDAIKAGWAAERVGIAGWPRIAGMSAGLSGVAGVLADTRAIEVPQRVKDFSSQMLLWEMIEDELRNDPLSLGEDARKYLQVRMEQFNIAEEGFERNVFMEELIVPAYQQGICRLIMRHGIPTSLFGSGWSEISEFAGCARGAIADAGELGRAVSKCQVVVDVFPAGQPSLDAISRTVVRAGGLNSHQLLNGIRQALAGKGQALQQDQPSLNRNAVRALIPQVSGQ